MTRTLIFIGASIAAVFLMLLIGCTTKPNIKYCDIEKPCAAGLHCDFVKSECEPGDPDMAVANDMAEEPDLGEVVDLEPSPLPDLQEPDLVPPPDLEPLPDLMPPAVYFNPDIQNLINAGGGGGCAHTGCHDASSGLYVPFLIPNPSTPAAVHANYMSFSAEAQMTVIQKLLRNNGVAHGGTTTAPDRKPCTTEADEPCASLDRWYAEGMPENAP